MWTRTGWAHYGQSRENYQELFRCWSGYQTEAAFFILENPNLDNEPTPNDESDEDGISKR